MRVLFAVIVISFLPSVVVAAPNAGEQLIDSIVASVDGEPITLSEFHRYARGQGEASPLNIQKDRAKFVSLLRGMLLMQVLEKEASARGIVVGEQDVENYLAEIQRQNNVDRSGLVELLGKQGLSMKRYRRQIYADILRARVVNASVRNKINVVDEDIERFFEEYPDRRPQVGMVSVEQLSVELPDEASDAEREKLRAKIDQLRQQVADGGEFSAIGAPHFVDLGYIDLDDLLPEFRTAIEELPLGDVSDVVASKRGLFVFRVVARRGEGEQAIDQKLKNSIKQEIYERRYQKMVEKLLTVDLPEKYNIEMKL